MTREVFADEIAIDFPSLDHAIERVRDGFLGAPLAPGTITKEVLVSASDAATGTVVTLEIPVRGTCEECGGRGETWAEPCAACHGSGDRLDRRSYRFPVPPGVADGSQFRFRVSSARAASPDQAGSTIPVIVIVRVAIRKL